MTKEQQALNTLREKGYTTHFQPIKLEYQYPNEFKILQELVDKATPKKTIKSKNPLFDYMVFCPACNKSVSFKNYYCGSCGQALDWSDEVDK